MPSKQADLKALKRLIKELERVLKIGPIPVGIQNRSAELFQAIYALTDDLIERTPAKQLGALGGAATAERMQAKNPDYYKDIAAMRKTNAGGRPKKDRTVLTENASPNGVRSRASFIIADRAKQLGLDLAGVAKTVGVSEQYARDLLQGKKVPSDQTIADLINGLKLNDFEIGKVRTVAAEDRQKRARKL